MKKIGIVCKAGRSEPLDIVRRLLPWLRERGTDVFLDAESAETIGIDGYPRERIPDLSEAIIVLGGDGTMLSVARLACKKSVPILGVNLGGLGFITEISQKEIFDALHMVLSGKCAAEDRLMLTARVTRTGKEIEEYTALNDVVINKGALARIVELDTSVNGVYVNGFRADGLIVSTPTGSTAYCLSAGGPILYPTMGSIILIPICPHTLSNRPIVLPDDIRLEIVLRTPIDDVFLTVDGQQGIPLRKDDVIAVEKSPYKTRLLIPPTSDFFEVLRTKLGWGVRSQNIRPC
ncbi:MAG TPA: NAD(+)/NADH kinase [Thermodesulfovibrionales bacterium]|jgi:NAD+ kinase|nr:NAD(+)/NADH kinase [Thermodesulfovibrionales bacterium]